MIGFYEVLFAQLKRVCCYFCSCCCCGCCNSDDEEDRNNPLTEPLINSDENNSLSEPDDENRVSDDNDDGCRITQRIRGCFGQNEPVITVIIGFKTILLNFYQMKELITIDAPSSPSSSSSSKTMNFIKEILPSILNLKITFQNEFDKYCPSLELDDITKLFIKNVLLFIALVGMAMSSIAIYQSCKYLKRRFCVTRDSPPDGERVPFDVRCKVFLARIILIEYINIVTFLLLVGFRTVTIYVNNKPVDVLLVNGEARWLHDPRSNAAIAVFFVWALPFIGVLYLVSRRLQDRKITINWFLLYLYVPLSYLFFLFSRLRKGESLEGDEVEEPNIKPLLSVFEAPFRESSNTNKKVLLWDARIILRRLIIAGICLLISNDFRCYIVVIPALAICCAHHARVVPYKGKLLNQVEISFLSLISISAINFLWAVFYVYRPPLVEPVLFLVNEMKGFEVFFILLPFILFISYLVVRLSRMMCC